MIVMAAVAFGHLSNPVTTIEQAHQTLGPLLGPAAATVFAVALFCSGLSSSTVGVMAGQVIIEGFLDIKFSIFLRRLITIIPAMVVIAIGLDPLKILILSQVVLSFALPFALVPLLVLTNRTSVMKEFCQCPADTGRGVVCGGDHSDAECGAAGADGVWVVDLRGASSGVTNALHSSRGALWMEGVSGQRVVRPAS